MDNEINPTLLTREWASIADVHVEPEIEGGFANAWINIEIDNHTREEQQVAATVIVKLGEIQEKIEVVDLIEPEGGVIETVIRIEEPEFWWPSGYGEQVLYTCMVGISVEGEIQDAAEARFGVRSVELLETSDEQVIVLNGEEIVSEPSVWAPPDQFVEQASEERYRRLAQEALEAGAMMIKAWGEGSEKDSAFYNICDELGLLVWQELAPGALGSPSEGFIDAVTEHIEEHVRNLRNHASIVVWCGSIGEAGSARGNRLLEEIIPGVIGKLDRTRPYLANCADPI